LLIDLIEAFDRIPREILWEIMTRRGVPVKLVSLLKALHKTVKGKFIIDDVEQTIGSIIEVKQGDDFGPDLIYILHGIS